MPLKQPCAPLPSAATDAICSSIPPSKLARVVGRAEDALASDGETDDTSALCLAVALGRSFSY